MAEWIDTYLSDILVNKGYIRGPFGSALKRGDMKEDGIPVYEQQHAIYNSRDFRYYIDEQKFNEMKRFQVRKNDLIISCSGTVGRVSIINDDDPKGIISQALLLLRADTNKILPMYLKYFFSSRDGYNAIVSRSSGSVQVNIAKRSVIEQIPLRLPQIKTQRKIVEMLSSIDDKIELNNAINNNLEQQAMTLFSNALQQSTSVFYVELGALADVKGGKRLPKGISLITVPNQHPYIRVRDLNNTVFASLSNDYEYVDDATQKSISRYIVTTGDVLISIVGTIGLTAIVDHTLNKANLTENCVKLTNLKNVTPEYLLLFLRSSQGVEAIKKGTVGAVQLKLPIKNIQSIAVPLLRDEELFPLNETLSAIFSQISANIVEMKQLADIRNTLLPRLMSGELDVSHIEL